MKVVTPNSGGTDSLVAIKRLHDQGYEQHSVFVDMGQPNRKRAMAQAKRIADKYCVSHEVITVSSDFRKTFATSNQNFTAVNKVRVPYPAFIFPILTAIVTICDDADYLSMGGFRPNRPGHTPISIRHRLDYLLNDTVSGMKIKLLQPLSNINDMRELVEAGKAHGLTIDDFNECVTCQSEEPCGECKRCKGRERNGLRAN